MQVDYGELSLHDIRRMFSVVVRKRRKVGERHAESRPHSVTKRRKTQVLTRIPEDTEETESSGSLSAIKTRIFLQVPKVERRLSVAPQVTSSSNDDRSDEGMIKMLPLGKCRSSPMRPVVQLKTTASEATEKGLFYRDVAIFRYKDEKAQVFSDSEFMNIFLKRTNDPYWQKIDYVQTNIKAKIGIGKPIYIDFYADLNCKNPYNNR